MVRKNANIDSECLRIYKVEEVISISPIVIWWRRKINLINVRIIILIYQYLMEEFKMALLTLNFLEYHHQSMSFNQAK